MQTTSIATKQVVWREGTLLRPQHLQQQQRHFEHQMQLRAALTRPHGWGLGTMDIDEDLLMRGELALRLVTAIFPSGLMVKVNPDQPGLPQRSITAFFERGQEELSVFLSHPQTATAQNTSANTDHFTNGYESSSFDIQDALAPEQSATIELAWPKIKILLGHEAQDQSNLIPIAKIIRQGKGYRLDPTFIPPSLSLCANSGLEGSLRALLTKAHERLQELKSARSRRDKDTLSFDPKDLHRYLWLTSLSGSIAVFESILQGQGTSPHTVYLELVRWAGRLACLSHTTMDDELQGYIHARSHESFIPVFDQLFDLLDQSVSNDYHVIDLKRRSDGMWLAKFDEEHEGEEQTFILAVKSQQGYEKTARKLPALAKLASFSQISKVIDHAVSGAQLSYLPRPPSTIPLLPDWAYFSIHQKSRYWADILKTKCIAFYAGHPFDQEGALIRVYSTKEPLKTQLRLA